MDGNKLAAFIKDWVVGRPCRKAGKRGERLVGPPAQARPGEKTVSRSVIDLYIAAIVGLYEQQRQDGVNNKPHPCTGPIRQLINTIKRSKHAQSKAAFKDKGKGERY